MHTCASSDVPISSIVSSIVSSILSQPHTDATDQPPRGFAKRALQVMERLPEASRYEVYCALRALGVKPSQVMLKLVMTPPQSNQHQELLAVQLFNDWVR